MHTRSDNSSLAVPKENTYNKYKCTWIISKCSFVHCRRILKSSPIWIGVNNDIRCTLNLFSHGGYFINKDFLSLAIALHFKKPPVYKSNIKCSILNAEKKKFNISTLKLDTTNNDTLVEAWVDNSFCHRSFLFNNTNGLLPGDKLRIFCEIKVYSDISNVVGQPYTVQLQEPDSKLRESFENILFNDKLCDIKFAIGDRELGAHKLILAARSEVFAAMFEHKMEENISNSVTITDVKYEVFKEMLLFIYSGKAPNLNKMANDLFAAAEKYNLKTLKIMCENVMSNKLSVETAVDALLWTDGQ